MTKTRSVAATANDNSIPGSRLENTTVGNDQLSADIDASKILFSPLGTGALASRSVELKLQDAQSVKDFGAVGDNSADDTAAFQAAIDYGGTIFIPKGTYKITGSLILKGSIIVVGEGQNKSILRSEIVGDSLFKCTSEIAWLQFHNFDCLGNGLTGTAGNGHCFNLIDPSPTAGAFAPQRVVMDNVRVRDFKGFDIRYPGVTDKIESCGLIQVSGLQNFYANSTFQNCGHGMYFQLCQNTKVDNCVAVDCQKYAVIVYDCENFSVDRCDLLSSGDGVESTGYPISNFRSGIFLSCQNQNLVFTRNKLKNTNGIGSVVSYLSDNDVIDSNWIRSDSTATNQAACVYAERSPGIRITKNTFTTTRISGTGLPMKRVELYNTQSFEPMSATIEDNVFFDSGTQDFNIKIHGNSSARLFSGVSIRNNQFGNRIASPESASYPRTTQNDILISNCTLQRSVISNNTFYAASGGVRRVNCISASGASISDGNTIGPNGFVTNGGAIPGIIDNEYSGIFPTLSAPVFNDTTRPTAASSGQGAVIFNTDDNTLNVSDGSGWRDMSGNPT